MNIPLNCVFHGNSSENGSSLPQGGEASCSNLEGTGIQSPVRVLHRACYQIRELY